LLFIFGIVRLNLDRDFANVERDFTEYIWTLYARKFIFPSTRWIYWISWYIVV